MIKLFPKESTDELRDALIASVWVIGVLAFGTLALWLSGLLISVSLQSPIGFGGAIAVILLAGGVGAFVYRSKRSGRRQDDPRRPSQNEERNEPLQSASQNASGPIVERVVRPHRPSPLSTKTEAIRPIEALDPSNPDDLFSLKRQLSDTLGAGDFEKAERIISRVEEIEAQREWCQIQRQAIELTRRRSG